MELDLVPCIDDKCSHFVMEELLSFKVLKKSDEKHKSDVKVTMASSLGTYEIARVHSMQPKALRSGVESVLRICKNYKTLQ